MIRRTLALVCDVLLFIVLVPLIVVEAWLDRDTAGYP
jgi:hypothetical protein